MAESRRAIVLEPPREEDQDELTMVKMMAKLTLTGKEDESGQLTAQATLEFQAWGCKTKLSKQAEDDVEVKSREKQMAPCQDQQVEKYTRSQSQSQEEEASGRRMPSIPAQPMLAIEYEGSVSQEGQDEARNKENEDPWECQDSQKKDVLDQEDTEQHVQELEEEKQATRRKPFLRTPKKTSMAAVETEEPPQKNWVEKIIRKTSMRLLMMLHKDKKTPKKSSSVARSQKKKIATTTNQGSKRQASTEVRCPEKMRKVCNLLENITPWEFQEQLEELRKKQEQMLVDERRERASPKEEEVQASGEARASMPARMNTSETDNAEAKEEDQSYIESVNQQNNTSQSATESSIEEEEDSCIPQDQQTARTMQLHAGASEEELYVETPVDEDLHAGASKEDLQAGALREEYQERAMQAPLHAGALEEEDEQAEALSTDLTQLERIEEKLQASKDQSLGTAVSMKSISFREETGPVVTDGSDEEQDGVESSHTSSGNQERDQGEEQEAEESR